MAARRLQAVCTATRSVLIASMHDHRAGTPCAVQPRAQKKGARYRGPLKPYANVTGGRERQARTGVRATRRMPVFGWQFTYSYNCSSVLTTRTSWYSRSLS